MGPHAHLSNKKKNVTIIFVIFVTIIFVIFFTIMFGEAVCRAAFPAKLKPAFHVKLAATQSSHKLAKTELIKGEHL